MAAIAFTKIRATAHQIVYSWTSTGLDVDGIDTFTRTNAQMIADATTAGPLATALAACSLQTDTTAKAASALLSGEGFTGAASLATITTQIQSSVLHRSSTAAFAAPVLDANAVTLTAPSLVLTTLAAGTGFVFVTHRWSPTV